MDKYNLLNDNLNRQLAWIAKADSRLSVIVPICLAMTGALAARAPKSGNWDCSTLIFSSITIGLIFLSLFFCLLATVPRTTGSEKSLIFFNGIISYKPNEYSEKILEIESIELLEDIALQTYTNANIASIKFSWIKKAQVTLCLASLVWVISIYLTWT